MEPLENDALTDDELDQLLAQWPALLAPGSMRTSLCGPAKPWPKRLWAMSIRIPFPVALVLAVALGLFVVEKRRSGSLPATTPNAPLGFRELHPVMDFNPRIIKGRHADN